MRRLREHSGAVVAAALAGGAAAGVAGCHSDATLITVHIQPFPPQTLALLAYRDGLDGEWQSALPWKPGIYAAYAHGPYSIEAVAVATPSTLPPAQTVEVSRTLEDPLDVEVQFDPEASTVAAPSSPTVDVRGTMAQIGTIWFGEDEQFADMAVPWSFDVKVARGTYDLVALDVEDQPHRVAIRRDLAVSGATALPLIDDLQEGAALVELPVTIANLGSLTATLSYELDTANGTRAQPFDASNGLRVPDPALLRATDVQRVTATVTDQPGAIITTRTVTHSFAPGAPAELTLPPPFAPTLSRGDGSVVMSWTTLAPYEHVAFTFAPIAGGDESAHPTMRATRDLSASYVSASGATTARIDVDLPGYQPSWALAKSTPPISYNILANSTGANGADRVQWQTSVPSQVSKL